jgi:hypothetical protein
MADEETDDNESSESKIKKPGCALTSALLGAAALSGGIYLLGRWDAIAGVNKALAIILVMIGTLLIAPLLILLVLKLVMRYFLRKVTRGLSEAAGQMISANKAMYGQTHEFRGAEEDDFDIVDRAFYEDNKQKLSELGYRHLGDVVDATIEETNDLAIPIRVITSADGTTGVALYHFSMGDGKALASGQKMLICDVSTEFSDGTFLITSNTGESDLMTPPPRLERRRHPLTTPVLDLIGAHEAEKQKLLAGKPGVTAVAIHTLAQALDSEKRQQQAKNEFRKEIGYIDPEEVKRIAEKSIADQDLRDMTADAVDKARRREQAD